MSNRINKNAIIILIIIEIGYFLRGSLPAMCYFTPVLSKYKDYSSTYFFNLLDFIFLFLALSVGIFRITEPKTLLKTFGLAQPLKLVTDIANSLISNSSVGAYWIYPMLNFYLLIINIILINTYFVNHGKISRKFLKPAAFCVGAIVFQFLIYLIPTAIYLGIELFKGNTSVNGQMPLIMLIVQIVACYILQVIGGNMLAEYGISVAINPEISRGKKQSLIIYGITLLGSLLLLVLFYFWIKMPNTIVEIIRLGFLI